MGKVTYDPTIFAADSLESAKEIIVTPTGDMTTEERWEKETPYLAALLGELLDIRPGQLVVDYGCGVGRLSRALIERYDCLVVGVDSSDEMRGLAPGYVESSAFSAVSRRVFQAMCQRGFRADSAFSVWVLQHCPDPAQDIRLISSSLQPGAKVAIVNTLHRVVPAVETRWASDGLDMKALLHSNLTLTEEGELDAAFVGARTAGASFWASYLR